MEPLRSEAMTSATSPTKLAFRMRCLIVSMHEGRGFPDSDETSLPGVELAGSIAKGAQEVLPPEDTTDRQTTLFEARKE